MIALPAASANIEKCVQHTTVAKPECIPTSRRRTSTPLGKKLLVYFTEDERKIVDTAAALERRSISSFVANAAIRAAEQTVSSLKKPSGRR